MFLVFIILIMVVAYIMSYKRYKWLYIIAKTFKRDYRGMKMFRVLKKKMKNVKKHNLTVHKEFLETVNKHPDKVAVIFEEQRWTFAMMEDYCNKIGNYFNLEGFKKGDCISLLCDNRPEYVCVWVGLSKFGICTALVNTNVVQDSLVHSLEAVECKALIFEAHFADTVSQIQKQIPNVRLYQLEDSGINKEVLSSAVDLSQQLNVTPATPIQIQDCVNHKDPVLYIYTSGTTGMPKAAVFTQIRYLTLQAIVSFFNGNDDVIYNPMPLYHTFGIMGVTICFGATVVIKKKFSATQFWNDCAKHNCTTAMYIGEMCRYILNVPNIEIPKHKVKKIVGNGLKSDVWVKFVEKFQIEEVIEFYTSTEGVIVFVNLDNRVGAAGFIPRYIKSNHSTQLVKYDEESEEPVRDYNGLCVPCRIGEPGLAVGKIDETDIVTTFWGYTDKAQSRKKLIKDVIDIGDVYFNSGDILEYDELGYIYFKDRIGDTFRWKGENVSTFEVESVISKLIANLTVVVFGVKVPGTEGKAGMAVIVDTEKILNLSTLSTDLLANLPKYAVPMFIRITANVSLTSTYKIRKMEFKAEGYDLDQVNDPIYFFDASLKKYVLLTRDLYEDLKQRRIHL